MSYLWIWAISYKPYGLNYHMIMIQKEKKLNKQSVTTEKLQLVITWMKSKMKQQYENDNLKILIYGNKFIFQSSYLFSNNILSLLVNLWCNYIILLFRNIRSNFE